MNNEMMILEYCGYNTSRLETFNKNVLDNVGIAYSNLTNEQVHKLKDSYNSLLKFDSISLDKVKKGAIDFYSKYFKINKINMMKLNDANKIISKPENGYTFNLKNDINKNIKVIEPFDLPIKLVDGHSMVGSLSKPIICVPGIINDSGRKIYYSDIHLGKNLNKLSIATYIHEIAHTMLEQNIGYTKDFFSKEVINIFLEKVAAYELDPTKKLLDASETARTKYLFDNYFEVVHSKTKDYKTKKNNLLYIKSTLMANKLFDNYISEENDEERLTYMSDIQNIFDGKERVDDMLKKRDITAVNSSEPEKILKHM